jgi:hypothetical protein
MFREQGKLTSDLIVIFTRAFSDVEEKPPD